MMLSFDIHVEEDRKVKCPCCPALLLKPMCVEVFQCPNCAIKLQAKGITSRTQKRLAEQPSYDFYGRTPRQNIMFNDGQTEEHLSEHESINQQGQISTVKQSETLLVPETQKKDSEFQHPSAMLGATKSTGQLISLDPVCIDMEASNTQKESLQQSPNRCEGQAQSQDPVNDDATEESMPEDESIEQQGRNLQINQNKTVSVLKTLVKEESMISSYSAMSIVSVSEARLSNLDSIDIDEKGTKIGSPNFRCYSVGDAASGSKEIECLHGEEMLGDCVMQQNCLDEKPETRLIFQSETMCCELIGGDSLIAEGMERTNDKDEGSLVTNNGMVTACTEMKDVSSECDGVEEPFQEGNIMDKHNDGQFDSHIIRDNDYELSFKYIASPLKSNLPPEEKAKVDRLAKLPLEVTGGKGEMKKGHSLSLELSFSNINGSDDHESCSSYSGSTSHGDLDSEFDFPSPSAESTHLTKQSDSYSSNVLCCPQQQEWQDADADEYSMIARDQKSNSSIASGIQIVGKIATAVKAHADLRGKEDIEHGLPVTCDLIMSKPLHEPKMTDMVFSQVQDKKHSQSQGLLEERLADESGIFVPSTISVPLECKNKDSLVDSVDCKENSRGKANGELLEFSGSYGDRTLNLKPSSILIEECQPLGTDLSTSTLLLTSQMKTCLTVEDPELTKSVSNLPLNDSAFRMHDNVVDTLNGVKREEGQVVSPIAHCGGYNANNYSGLPKECNIDGMHMPYRSEQLRVSQTGGESEWHYARDTFHKKGQVHNKVAEILKRSDQKDCHKINNSFYAERPLSHKDAGNQGYQENILDEDLYPPAQRTLERSFDEMQEGHAQADSILAGSSLHVQDSQADLYMVGQTFNINAFSSFPASSCSYGSDGSFDESRSSGHPACSCQAPTLPFGLPIAMHSHPFSHDLYHPVCPVCVPHFPGQGFAYPHLPVQSCLHCLRTVGHYQGHPELEHYHGGFQGKGSCMLCHSFKRNPLEIAPMHETALVAAKASRSSANKPTKYPPLPQEGMAPYVICKHCNDILEVSVCLSSRRIQKLRCGACRKVSKFSVNRKTQKVHIAGLQPSAEALPSRGSPPSFEWMARKREQNIADLGQNKISSYGESFFVQNKRGSVSSRDLMGGHHNLRSEMTSKIKPSLDIRDAKLPTARNEPSSQDEFFFRRLSRKSESGSSQSLFSGFKTMSLKFEANHVVHEKVNKNGDTSLQSLVDEKEEGLDFGAPRPSDGDSLDQRSPEKFDSVNQPMQTSSIAEEKSWVSEIQPEFQSEEGRTTDPLRSRLTLFALFNQESIKFRIPLEKGDPFEESLSRLRSLVHKPMNQKPAQSEKEIAPLNMKKGPRHIAAMLTRSWKHQARN